MDHDAYIATIGAEAAVLAEVARTTPLDTNVPTCPEWTIAELVEHTSSAHRFAMANMDRDPADGPTGPEDQRPDEMPVDQWLLAGAEMFCGRLSSTDPSARCWTFTDNQTVGFWARRHAHETAMHRWDGQNAAGDPQSIEPELAADGIDEYLGLVPFFVKFRPPKEPWGDGETIHFHSTDAPGEWLVRMKPDGADITREHAKGDVAARAPASDLLLVVMGRQPASSVETFGDASLIDRWQQRASF